MAANNVNKRIQKPIRIDSDLYSKLNAYLYLQELEGNKITFQNLMVNLINEKLNSLDTETLNKLNRLLIDK